MPKPEKIFPKLAFRTALWLLTVILMTGCGISQGSRDRRGQSFNQERAYGDVIQQLEFGPRFPGSEGHQKTVEYIIQELRAAGWTTQRQVGTKMGHPVINIIAYRESRQPYLLLGAHYDTRMHADQDPHPEQRTAPVPGANDGASGVAVLLEIARTLPASRDIPVRLVFFDAEDNGSIPGWDWILGSRLYAETMETDPVGVVIVDMVGDKDLNLFRERNSTRGLQDQIWDVASRLGYENTFIDEEKHSILDDHTPFLEEGIAAVDIIDFDYPYWHTTRDTLDKVSARSLDIVGETLLVWLENVEVTKFE